MFAKSVGVLLMLAASTALGCAASTEDETDETHAVSSSLSPSGDDVVMPAPFEPKIPGMPSLEEGAMRRPIWDLRRWVQEERTSPFDFGGSCWQYMQKIYDPGAGKYVEIPITVCK